MSDLARLSPTTLRVGRVYQLWFAEERTQGPYRVLITEIDVTINYVHVHFTLPNVIPNIRQHWDLRLYGDEAPTVWFTKLPALEELIHNPDAS